MTTRYTAEGPQAEFEPGSRGKVLRNRLGITRIGDMHEAESDALRIALATTLERAPFRERFTAHDVCELHRLWLGEIYSWAGEYRTVNIGKGGFQFATAALVQALMGDLGRGALAQFTPCGPQNAATLARALAEVHAELILVHPFRDGNGRLARLLSVLMAAQAGLPPLNFSALLGRGKPLYIASIHAAVGRDYRPLAALFERVIAQTLKPAASPTSR